MCIKHVNFVLNSVRLSNMSNVRRSLCLSNTVNLASTFVLRNKDLQTIVKKKFKTCHDINADCQENALPQMNFKDQNRSKVIPNELTNYFLQNISDYFP